MRILGKNYDLLFFAFLSRSISRFHPSAVCILTWGLDMGGIFFAGAALEGVTVLAAGFFAFIVFLFSGDIFNLLVKF